MAVSSPLTVDDAVGLLLDAEKNGLIIPEPQSEAQVQVYRRAANKILADRLLVARNRSRLNNDKINRRMHSMYMEHNRPPKGWMFTNILSPRNKALPDGEEASMLAKILGIREESLEIHLKTMPWLKSRMTKSKQKSAKDKAAKETTPILEDIRSETNDHGHDQTWIIDEKYSTPDVLLAQANVPGVGQVGKHEGGGSVGTREAGDLKISQDGSNLVVSGKVWCSKEVATKLRMIVPMRLINQERGDDPWCYEIQGPVHAYQLYNIMHVLYGAPKVLEVAM